jgi:glycosyltransferase involved in cell wall biosynthesis
MGYEQDTVLLCAVGSLGAGVNKRVDVSIAAVAQAFKQGANVALVVCGDGPLRPVLEKQACDLGVSDRVRFLGWRQDVPQVMRSCDIFIHAAASEPFGIVAIEAMAMGIPAIVPAAGGIPETVVDGRSGLTYRALDADALAARILELCRSPRRRAEIGRSGRQRVLARFTVAAYMDRLYGMYGLN